MQHRTVVAGWCRRRSLLRLRRWWRALAATTMQDGTIIGRASGRSGRLGLGAGRCILGRLPLAFTHPTLKRVDRAVNGEIAHGSTGFLCLVHYAHAQSHGPGFGFIDGGVMK